MKETLRILPKKFAKPAAPFAVGFMAFVGSFVDIGITDEIASKDANKVFPPNASREELANAMKEIGNFDQLIIDRAHSGATNIDTLQIPRKSEAMQALDLINQETEISQKRDKLRVNLNNKSLKRQLSIMATGFGLMGLGALWDTFRNRRNKNIVSEQPAKS